MTIYKADATHLTHYLSSQGVKISWKAGGRRKSHGTKADDHVSYENKPKKRKRSARDMSPEQPRPKLSVCVSEQSQLPAEFPSEAANMTYEEHSCADFQRTSSNLSPPSEFIQYHDATDYTSFTPGPDYADAMTQSGQHPRYSSAYGDCISMPPQQHTTSHPALGMIESYESVIHGSSQDLTFPPQPHIIYASPQLPPQFTPEQTWAIAQRLDMMQPGLQGASYDHISDKYRPPVYDMLLPFPRMNGNQAYASLPGPAPNGWVPYCDLQFTSAGQNLNTPAGDFGFFQAG